MFSNDNTRTYTAGGNVLPMSVVKRDTANDFKCTQAGAGDDPLGIVSDWTRNAPFSPLDDGYNAIAGENVKVFMPGARGVKAKLHADSGSVTPGTKLMPGSGGLLTPVTANNDKFIAIANTAGTGGKIIEVDVVYGFYGA